MKLCTECQTTTQHQHQQQQQQKNANKIRNKDEIPWKWQFSTWRVVDEMIAVLVWFNLNIRAQAHWWRRWVSWRRYKTIAAYFSTNYLIWNKFAWIYYVRWCILERAEWITDNKSKSNLLAAQKKSNTHTLQLRTRIHVFSPVNQLFLFFFFNIFMCAMCMCFSCLLSQKQRTYD